MINDYKSHRDLLDSSTSKRHPRLGLIAIVGLTLCASAIYAALASGDKNKPAVTAVLPTEEPVVTTAPKTPAPLATQKEVALLLPGQADVPPVATSSHTAETAEPAVKLKVASIELPKTQAAPAIIETPEQVTTLTPAQETESTLQDEINSDESVVSIDQGTWLEEKVRSGDNLALIFSRLKLSPNLLHRIINSSKEAKGLAKIRPGESVRVRVDKQGELLELVHKRSAIRSLQILPTEESFSAQVHDRSLEKRVASTTGTITNSLYLSAQRAGLSDSLTMELANIFGWDIDFALEIRAGDQFSLIYEEEYLDGKKYRNGSILAAEFINQGKVFRAIRFEDDDGYSSYFSPEGDSMRKAFLRAPVDFRRISSRFTKARYHPVLGKKRPHKGVDYSAATGTPIKAAGDGRVIFRGTKGGYGRTVILRHGSQYTTLYAHMSKYRSSVKNGTRVRQGQVIGYVGKSGLATGPHLHYEFRVNGVHRNPLTIKLPAAEPLAKKYKSRFNTVSTPLLAQLDLVAKTMVADARERQR
ncbi:MAG: peptidoglycan DD-metalloendopeptidase family protein [Sedimenticola sp.]|nr:peptidoglycan DD-metalloendopeptidase family protein [Sedimenticola sp.]